MATRYQYGVFVASYYRKFIRGPRQEMVVSCATRVVESLVQLCGVLSVRAVSTGVFQVRDFFLCHVSGILYIRSDDS